MKLTLKDIHPGLDGSYDFDESYFTNWELHAIKNLSGLTAGKLEQAFSDLDNDMVVSMAMLALMRAGKITSKTPWDSEQVDSLWHAPMGKIAFEFEEADAGPPEMSPESDDAASASNGSSGDPSSLASESPDNSPSPTGSPL